jgi:hypothetical protein
MFFCIYWKMQRCLPCRFVEWELWPWKHLRLWINCRHHVSITLCIYEIQNIIACLDKKLTSTKTKQYKSKSYMQIKRAKTVAEYLSSACRTATFSTNSFSQFKSLLQSWNGSKCRCSACRWLKFCFWFAYICFILYFFNY